jgi:uncharacterized protein
MLSLEDTRLYGFGPGDFAAMISVLDEWHPGGPVYLDEVQEVHEWERLVRTLLDAGRRVCVTTSSASLHGGDAGAKLTGRHIAQEVYPFSYREYLAFTGEVPSAVSLENYLRRGGLPGALHAGPAHAPVLLRELLRDIVQRDIVSRHALRAVRPLMTLALHLIAHAGQPLSLHAIARRLGLPSAAQAARFVEYLLDAWLLLAVPRFSASFRQRVISPPKYYPIDTGLAAANSPNPIPDLGRNLENAILLALRRKGDAPAYAVAPHEWECKFVTPALAIQVCARVTPENRIREFRGLVNAATLAGGDGGKPRQLIVLTMDQEDALSEQGHSVTIAPAWRWLD